MSETEVRIEGMTKTVKAQWLIGCDGMHSAVREQSGIAFVGAAYEQGFVLAESLWIGRWTARKSLYSTRPRGLS